MRSVGTMAMGVACVVLVTGCASGGDQGQRAADPDAPVVGHVHGLGTDAADGTLYVATHVGVFRAGEAGSMDRVADRWQDTMAFTVAGPGHFVASGHRICARTCRPISV
jgi:hypothetical protein